MGVLPFVTAKQSNNKKLRHTLYELPAQLNYNRLDRLTYGALSDTLSKAGRLIENDLSETPNQMDFEHTLSLVKGQQQVIESDMTTKI